MRDIVSPSFYISGFHKSRYACRIKSRTNGQVLTSFDICPLSSIVPPSILGSFLPVAFLWTRVGQVPVRSNTCRRIATRRLFFVYGYICVMKGAKTAHCFFGPEVLLFYGIYVIVYRKDLYKEEAHMSTVDRSIAHIGPGSSPFGTKPMPRFTIPDPEEIRRLGCLNTATPRPEMTGTAVALYVARDRCEGCPFGTCAKGNCIRNRVELAEEEMLDYEHSFSGKIAATWMRICAPFARTWRWLAYAE